MTAGGYVFVYEEYTENRPWGDRITEIFENRTDAVSFLKERVEHTLAEAGLTCEEDEDLCTDRFEIQIDGGADEEVWRFFSITRKYIRTRDEYKKEEI